MNKRDESNFKGVEKKKEDLYGEDPLDDEMDKAYDGDLIDDEIMIEDEVDEMPETRLSSRASMYNAKIAISIDKDDELAILKNVYGSTKKLTSNESVKLISKILNGYSGNIFFRKLK